MEWVPAILPLANFSKDIRSKDGVIVVASMAFG